MLLFPCTAALQVYKCVWIWVIINRVWLWTGLEAGGCVLCVGASPGGRFGGLYIPLSIYGGHSQDACLLKRDQQWKRSQDQRAKWEEGSRVMWMETAVCVCEADAHGEQGGCVFIVLIFSRRDWNAGHDVCQVTLLLLLSLIFFLYSSSSLAITCSSLGVISAPARLHLKTVQSGAIDCSYQINRVAPAAVRTLHPAPPPHLPSSPVS